MCNKGRGTIDMEEVKKKAYTKRRLIKELAFRSGISQNQARAALEAIIEIAYREARENYFILPGLCKFDVVRRQARHVRNPMTGESLVLPERDALHVVLSKRAKEAVAPRVAPMKEEEYAAFLAAKAETVAPDTSEDASAAEKQTASEGTTTSDNGEISFFCSTCGQEIIAPGEAAGCEAECPTCGALLTVPTQSVQGSACAEPGEEEAQKEIISSEEVEDLNPQTLKNRTIRIDAMLLSDLDREPTPSADDSPMASAMKSRTMRIDLPDEF